MFKSDIIVAVKTVLVIYRNKVQLFPPLEVFVGGGCIPKISNRRLSPIVADCRQQKSYDFLFLNRALEKNKALFISDIVYCRRIIGFNRRQLATVGDSKE
uniref:Uncharacterized protein n=1 Tax=Romanomermis culicivorax TaxID=13658 RepID=A0A915JY11_ROMCU